MKYYRTHPDLYRFLEDECNRLFSIVNGDTPSDDLVRDNKLFLALQQQLGKVDVPVPKYRERILKYLKAHGRRATQRQIQEALEPGDDDRQGSVANDIRAAIDEHVLWPSGAGGRKDPKTISLDFDPKIHKKPKR